MTRRLRAPWSSAAALGGWIVLLVVLGALLAPWIAPWDPQAVQLDQQLAPPSLQHWFGTDQSGRDLLSRVIWGARPSLEVGTLAVLVGLLVGVPLGLVSGFYNGGWLEQVVMRVLDAIAAIPTLIWAIAVVGIVGVAPLQWGPFSIGNQAKLTVLLGLLYVPGLARVTYVAASVEARADYVAARQMQAVPGWRIMLGDVGPNTLSPVIIQATLLVAVGILIEAAVSFIGLGVQPPEASWGNMLAASRDFLFSGEWWLSLFPGLGISVAVIGFNLVGDGLRDLLDPRRQSMVPS